MERKYLGGKCREEEESYQTHIVDKNLTDDNIWETKKRLGEVRTIEHKRFVDTLLSQCSSNFTWCYLVNAGF